MTCPEDELDETRMLTITCQAGALLRGRLRRQMQAYCWKHGYDLTVDEEKGLLSSALRFRVVVPADREDEARLAIELWLQRLQETEAETGQAQLLQRMEIDWIDLDAGRLQSMGYRETMSWLQLVWTNQKFERLAGQLPDNGHGITDNPFWEIVRLVPIGRMSSWIDPWAVEMFSMDRPLPQRQSLVDHFTWSIPSPGDITWLKTILDGRGVVEIGAGNGYWAWQLAQVDVSVAAYDIAPRPQPWHPVRKGNHSKAAKHSDRALMLIWPPYSEAMAALALQAYRGDLLIYAGEGEWGCTGDAAFHAALERDWEWIGESPAHPTWDGIHCRLNAYRRLPVDDQGDDAAGESKPGDTGADQHVPALRDGALGDAEIGGPGVPSVAGCLGEL